MGRVEHLRKRTTDGAVSGVGGRQQQQPTHLCTHRLLLLFFSFRSDSVPANLASLSKRFPSKSRQKNDVSPTYLNRSHLQKATTAITIQQHQQHTQPQTQEHIRNPKEIGERVRYVFRDAVGRGHMESSYHGSEIEFHIEIHYVVLTGCANSSLRSTLGNFRLPLSCFPACLWLWLANNVIITLSIVLLLLILSLLLPLSFSLAVLLSLSIFIFFSFYSINAVIIITIVFLIILVITNSVNTFVRVLTFKRIKKSSLAYR